MTEDKEKIDNKLKELNGSDTSGKPLPSPWIAIDGNNALTKVDLNTSPPTFNPAAGVPVKIFVDQKTGEMKIFPAHFFQK